MIKDDVEIIIGKRLLEELIEKGIKKYYSDDYFKRGTLKEDIMNEIELYDSFRPNTITRKEI